MPLGRERQRLAEAARLLLAGTLDKEGSEALRDEERARLDAAEEGLASMSPTVKRVSAKLPPLDFVLRLAGGWLEIVAAGSISAKRDLLGLLIAKVAPQRAGWCEYAPVITA